jgi:signal transduction histidine kinase
MLSRKIHSLQFITGVVVLLAFALAIGAFWGLQRMGDWLIQDKYMSEEKCTVRQNRYIHNFEEFINKNSISSTDTLKIKKWCREKKYVYLLVYKGDRLYYETDGNFIQTYDIDESESLSDADDLQPVSFADGTYGISIIEFSEDKYYNLVGIASLIASILLLITIVLIYTGRIIDRILTLSKDVKAVRDGDLKRDMVVSGCDELASLQNDIDDMRKSIIRHYEGEQEALKANSELLTSISHDIRTPLTSLMVYADALADSQVDDKQEVIRYASICRDKAYQLKELTDTLFRYFLVYGKQDVELKEEEYDASMLLQQLLGEHIVFLQQKNYLIRTVPLRKDCRIKTDAAMLNRVFDNVFSNLEKYADRSRQIHISEEDAGTFLKIQVKNYNAINNERAESTKIGLKTCQRIMEILGGDFIYMRNKDSFITQVIIPVLKK